MLESTLDIFFFWIQRVNLGFIIVNDKKKKESHFPLLKDYIEHNALKNFSLVNYCEL